MNRARSLPAAVYLLSFWHYYLYWLAFSFAAILFDVFKRDAVAMKTVSVAALATVYLGAPLDPVSLIVIAGGVLLTPARRFLKNPWFWLGVALALLIVMPNLVWQAHHHFISLAFLRSIHTRDIGWGWTAHFLPNQLYVCINVVSVPLFSSAPPEVSVACVSVSRLRAAVAWLPTMNSLVA